MQVGKRILEELQRRGWSQAELGRRMDVSAQTVSYWCSGETAPNRRHWPTLARIFGWPSSAFDPMTSAEALPQPGLPASQRVVPITPWSDIASEHGGTGQLRKKAAKGKKADQPETTVIDSDLPDDCFAVVVIDDSMAPIEGDAGGINVGDTLIISKSEVPERGDVVLVQMTGGKPILRQYLPRGGTAIDLIPTNGEYASETMNKSKTGLVLGVMVEHRRRRPKRT